MDEPTLQRFDHLNMLEGYDDSEQNITLEFGPFEAVHRWKRMLECDQFVGSRRSKHTVVAYKDAIYVFGGDNSRCMLNDLIRFDVKEKSWGRAFSNGTPPAPRYHHSAVVHGTSMYVFGGYTGDILANSNLTNKNDMFEYKFLTGQWLEWKFQGVMPVPRSAHGAAVYDDKLWIYAGYDGNARLNDMWTINLVSGNADNRQWEQVEQRGQCPPTCCNFPAVVARGRMYVFSGQSGAKITNALFQFDFAEKTWTRISTEHILRCAGPAPARRYGHTMLPHDRHLYVFGGTADNTLPNDLHCYDLDTEMWSVVHPTADSQVPSGRLFHAGAVVGDAMYIFGGTVDNKTRSAELYRFQFSTYPQCTLHDDFGRFLKSRMFCDVECLVGPEQTPVLCHQAFLAGRSEYLRDKIQAARELHELDLQSSEVMHRGEGGSSVGDNQEWLLKVYLPEATPQAFTMLLHYIYTDRIDPTEKEGEPSSAGTMLVVLELLALAERMRVPRLQALCSRYLRATLARHNVLPALHAAHRTQLPTVKEYCLRFVVKDANYTHIVMSSEFEEMDKDLMVEVIRRRQVPASKPFWNDCDDDNVGTTLEQDMRALLSSGLLADVRLSSSGRVREAHRTVLAARASYFEAMFRSFAPPDNTVNIQICHVVPSPDAFDSLLRYIYYGDTQMPPENSMYLFQAPVFYGFTNNRLQVFCKQNLESNVTPENVLPILAAADRLRATVIKNYALCMIVKNFPKVARQPGLKDLNKHLLLDVLQALADGTETEDNADVNDQDDWHHAATHTSHSRK